LGEISAALIQDGLALSASALEGFARKLAGMGLLERSLAERSTLELERLRADRLRRRRRRLFRGELLRMRFSIGDPDALLDRTLPALRWCFTPAFLAVSVALFAIYFLVLAVEWPAFIVALKSLYTPSALTFGTIVVVWLTALVVIAIHELGHAYACKYFGGEVHEMGFMLIYFEPAFYCNVNDAWTFPELRSRLWVTAAGSWIQFVVASLAAVVWWLAVPGTLVSEVAMAAMLIGGVTTIVTNMNPLIPLDGYFALSDWLEIPNLRQRAFGYLSWAMKRHVFRLDVNQPPATDREVRVFQLYAALATCYITGIFLFLASLVLGWAGRFLGITGVLLTAALLVALAWSSISEWGRTAAMSFRIHRAALLASPWRKRGLIATVALVLVLLLVPRWITVTGGFTAMPARALVLIAPDSGIVRQVIAREGVRVAAGTPLVRIQDLALDQERAARLRAVDSLTTEQSRARAQGRGADAEQLDAERDAMAARLAGIDARLGALVLRARADGQVMTARPEQLTGRRVESGDTLVTVADSDSLDVRLTVSGAGATLVQPGQAMSLVTYASAGGATRAVVRSVSPAAGLDPGRPGVEIRARIGSGGPWRVGVTGEASVRLRRSNLLGALWWGVRQRVRSDLLL